VTSPPAATGGSSGSSGGGGSGLYPAGAPDWVRNPNANFPESQYVAAAGDGKTMEEAQYKARANLLGIFGMKLSDESVIAEMFSQTSSASGTNWNETVSSDRKISSSAEGILSGCEIKENFNAGNQFYALAVMEKAKAASTYTDIIKRLAQSITEVLNIPNKNTIDGYARYRVASIMAKDIDSCINVLRFVGGSGSVPAGLKSESEYMTEASNIIKTIPVRVVLTRGGELDREGRILSAFQKTIGNVGFRTGDNSSPYVLEVTLALSEVELAGQTNKFARYEITANLIQLSTRQGVVPTYSINGREGHATLSEAQQRAVRAAESKINSEYKDLLEDHLSQLR
jgi:hypothetical protein